MFDNLGGPLVQETCTSLPHVIDFVLCSECPVVLSYTSLIPTKAVMTRVDSMDGIATGPSYLTWKLNTHKIPPCPLKKHGLSWSVHGSSHKFYLGTFHKSCPAQNFDLPKRNIRTTRRSPNPGGLPNGNNVYITRQNPIARFHLKTCCAPVKCYIIIYIVYYSWFCSPHELVQYIYQKPSSYGRFCRYSYPWYHINSPYIRPLLDRTLHQLS